MIRGVSDLVNTKNNTATKKRWRAYACDVAAAYAIGFLLNGPVVRTPSYFGFSLDEFPNVKRWVSAIAERPAVVRALHVKFS